MDMKIKEFCREVAPPFLWKTLQRIGGVKGDYEYFSTEWSDTLSNLPGWNVQSVVDAYQSGWTDYLRRIQSAEPMDLQSADCASQTSALIAQNMRLIFAFALARAAYGRPNLRVLDWGGGIGHYFQLAKILLPECNLDWTIKDLPLLCEAGRRLSPQVKFTESDEQALASNYDLVFASGVLQYIRDWQHTAANLARVSESWLLITRLPVCLNHSGFVALQTSYQTTYPFWVLNRAKFLQHLEGCGMRLVREFLVGSSARIPKAPADWEQRGFLFRRVTDVLE